MARFVSSIINVSTLFSLFVIDHLVCEATAVARGDHDTFQKQSFNESGSECDCVAMNARCVSSRNTSTCNKCICFDQYKTFVSHFRKHRCSSGCVKDNTLLFFPGIYV